MSDKLDKVADLGRFLILAAILPGLVYFFALIILFPDHSLKVNSWIGTLGLSFNWLIGSAFTVFLGLIITSVTFAIEINFRRFTIFNRLFAKLTVSDLGVIEAQGKSVSYLSQLLGQAFMHFNISIGLLLILLTWVIWSLCIYKIPWTGVEWLKCISAMIVVVSNAIVSHNFYNWAQSAFEKLLNEMPLSQE